MSQKKARLLWILAITLVILLLIARYLATTEKTTGSDFSALSHDEIHRIVLEAPGEVKLEFEKTNGGWYLVKPFRRTADSSRIQVLLATLSLPKGVIYTNGEIDPVEAGLQPAHGALTLNDERFLFGDLDVNGDRRYLQNGEKITLVADIIFPLFAQGLNGFIDKRLIPPGINKLQTAGFTIDKSSGKWLSEQMPPADAEAKIAVWLEQSTAEILAWPLEDETALDGAISQLVMLNLAENNSFALDIFKIPKLVVVHPKNTDYAMVITAEQYKALGFDND